jgi:putative flippase GtrA
MGAGTSRQFARFALAGVAGLAVDVAVLYLALALGAGYYAGRVLSFLAAVWCTWQINRRATFVNGLSGSAWRQWWRYLGAMLGGGVFNYVVYSLVIAYGPPHPMLALAGVCAGSLAGMMVNFAGAKLLVFRA